MKKVLALVVAAAMGFSCATFAADATTTAPASASQTSVAKTTHHKKHVNKTGVAQKAQAAKKHHKKATAQSSAAQKPVEQKAQAAKKHHKKASHTATKPAAQPAA